MTARAPRQINSDYKGWIAQTCCVACLVEEGRINREVQVAHIRSGYREGGWRPTGMAEKPDDARTVGLCVGHHMTGKRAQHDTNEITWWEALCIHPPALCGALQEAFDNGRPGIPVVAMFAGRARRERAERAPAGRTAGD